MNEREPIPQDEADSGRQLNVGEVEDDFEKSLEEVQELDKPETENPDAS